MEELGSKLRASRAAIGANITNSSLPTISFAAGLVNLEAYSAGVSESFVAEFMILANTLVAEYFHRNNLPVVLRSQVAKNKQAEYVNTPRIHADLALDMYAHFTSPIRRLADLKVHQILTLHLHGTSSEALHELFDPELEEICMYATKGSRRAKSVSNACNRYCYACYLNRHQNARYTGEVVGRDKRGRWLVRLEQLGLQVIGARIPKAHEGLKLSFQVSVNWSNNTMFTRNAYAVAA